MSTQDLDARVRDLERHKDRTDGRLDGGSKAFNDLRKDIDRVTEKVAPKPLPIWQVLAAVFGMAGTLLGAWWTFRGEIDAKADKNEVQTIHSEQTGQKMILTEMKVTQEAMRATMGEIKEDVRALRRGDRR